jgi:hypothetical protein
MGIAAMVLGIVAAVFAFIPICGIIAFVPAVVGLVLGCVDVAMKSKNNAPKGQGIAGIVLNGAAIVIIIVWVFFIAANANDGLEELQGELERAQQESQQYR